MDFIAGQNDLARGSLYFLTDKYFFERKWQPITRESSISNVCMYGEIQLVRAEFSLHPQGVTRDLVSVLEPQQNKGMAAMVVGKAMTKVMTKLIMP